MTWYIPTEMSNWCGKQSHGTAQTKLPLDAVLPTDKSVSQQANHTDHAKRLWTDVCIYIYFYITQTGKIYRAQLLHDNPRKQISFFASQWMCHITKHRCSHAFCVFFPPSVPFVHHFQPLPSHFLTMIRNIYTVWPDQTSQVIIISIHGIGTIVKKTLNHSR